MTTTTFFTGSVPASTPRAGRPVNKALAGAQTAFKAPRSVVPAVQAYPWMTQAMLGNLSPRARRLLRADY